MIKKLYYIKYRSSENSEYLPEKITNSLNSIPKLTIVYERADKQYLIAKLDEEYKNKVQSLEDIISVEEVKIKD